MEAGQLSLLLEVELEPRLGKWGFEVEIDHLGDDCNNPCEPVAGQMVKKWLDSTLKQTGFADG